MSNTLNEIFKHFPNVQDRFNGKNKPLTNKEEVFLQLALFINEPEKYSFNLATFYNFLQNEDLVLGLKFITDFFQKETLLIKDKVNVNITIGEKQNAKMYNQTTFAKYLQEQGFNFTATKLGTYYRREKEKQTGKIPLGDIEINGTPYWNQSTVDYFVKKLKNEQ